MSTREQVFLRTGRNLFNLQLLEASIKDLLPRLRFTGTTEEIALATKRHRREIKKMGLGDLAERLHVALTAEAAGVEPSENVDLPVISFAYRAGRSEEDAARLRAAWKELVASRNRLVHSMLVQHDLTNDDDCRTLCKALDAQNDKTCLLIDEVARVRENLSAAMRVFVELIEKRLAQRESATERDGA